MYSDMGYRDDYRDRYQQTADDFYYPREERRGPSFGRGPGPYGMRERRPAQNRISEKIPLWTVGASLSLLSIMVLFVECLKYSLDIEGTAVSILNTNLLTILFSNGLEISTIMGRSQPIFMAASVLSTLAVAVYFYIMKDRSFEKCYIPACLGIIAVFLAFAFMTTIEQIPLSFNIVTVKAGIGVYIQMIIGIAVTVVSIAGAVTSKQNEFRY